MTFDFGAPAPPSDGRNFSQTDLLTHNYVYYLADLRTNDIVAEIPMFGITYANLLSKVGEASGKLKVNAETIKLGLRENTTPGRFAFYILRDDQPVWGGIVWKRKYDSRSRELTLQMKTFESYFYHRFQMTRKQWTSTDQLDMARYLLMSNLSATDIRIDISTALSGVMRERNIYPFEFKTTGEELEQLGNLINGFDWNVILSRDLTTGVISRKMEFYYPQRGLTQSSSRLLFEYPGGAIKDFSVEDDAENSGNVVWAIGAGEGTDQLTASAVDAPQLTLGWPKIELSTAHKSVTLLPTLQAHADRVRDIKKTPVTVFEVSVRADAEPVLGGYGPGDWARFRMTDDFITPPIDQMARITGIAVTVDDSGIENVKLTLGGDEIESENE